jgi:two-component system KDP operon response regulator KdpE
VTTTSRWLAPVTTRSPQSRRAVPIVVLSARHEEQARTDALDAGTNDYLSKPLSVAELLVHVEKALAERSRTTP